MEIDTLYPQYASLDSLEREGRGKDPSDPLLPRDIHDFRFFKRKRTKEERERERNKGRGERYLLAATEGVVEEVIRAMMEEEENACKGIFNGDGEDK